MKRISLIAVAAAASLAITAPVASAKPAKSAETKNIVEVASGDKNFSTLVSLVKKAGLVETLSGGEFTVFAPTNAAFNKLGKKTLAKVGKDKKLLTSILTYHVVKGAVPASTVVTLNNKRVKTVNGKTVLVRVAGGKVRVNSSRVTKTDVMASNGVIHVIDRVLLPPAGKAKGKTK
ncbi:MAG: fasciclin domain-containing protein [Solirubrobacteraceae bacterium]|jgi:uncharacterized surface protein with fasciclin (FAS1) repeats|nr:fasciclin domain-containing protein [Solirubrobacteraceae bacterium]